MAILIVMAYILTSCETVTVMCPEMAEAQYQTAVKTYGVENVQKWQMKNDHGPYAYHMQVKVRKDGKWLWLPNRPYTEALSSDSQQGCKPFKRIK